MSHKPSAGTYGARTMTGTQRDGTWLADARERRGYTFQSDAIRALERAGIKVDPSTFSAWESGARVPKPSNRTYRMVVNFFGANEQESPADATPAGLSDLGALQQQLVTAFEVQAQAVMALVQEMRLAREAEIVDLRARELGLLARIDLLEARMRSLHPELDTQAPSTPYVPRATEE